MCIDIAKANLVKHIGPTNMLPAIYIFKKIVLTVSISVLKCWGVPQMNDLLNILHLRYQSALKTSYGGGHVNLKIVSFTRT